MKKLTRISPRAKQRSRKLRDEMTETERLLWKKLRGKQINHYKFRRQHPYGKYILDFVCLEANLVIEVDGGQHQENTMYDQDRSRWLERQGFKVLRFWNNEVLDNLDAVAQVIWHELHPDIQPPSQPSP
jgi:very-short-patch-repair endonuclease